MPAAASEVSALERVIRRDRMIMAGGLAATTLLAWIYLVRAGAAMNAMTSSAQMHAAMGMADMAWGVSDWLALFVMWAVMMVAMMLPSAAPVILLVLGVYRRRDNSDARVAAASFVLGYVLVWTAFSAAASALQVGLHRRAILTADMRLGSTAVSGVVLVIAGVYQWLPVKRLCLAHCQSPVGFISRHFREGAWGGFTMGVRHGTFCVGCCWLLMALLFAVGVMNLLWVAALTALVLIEKLFSRGATFGRVAGAALAAWGLYLLAGGRA
jgi:predicted metal-binding membrane protein